MRIEQFEDLLRPYVEGFRFMEDGSSQEIGFLIVLSG